MVSTLFILSLLGVTAGSIGGGLTNGLDGMVLGGSAGLVLGVLAWITDNMEQERQSRVLLPEQMLYNLNTFTRLHEEQNTTSTDDRQRPKAEQP